jgi:ABC-type polysaccharide/polyol phosphate transport system ATPase subunit
VKRFYRYEHRTTTLRELVVRVARRQQVHVRRAEFSLVGFDLRVESGEGVAIIGPNGSGKSTALRLIAGIYEPSEGTIQTSGRVAAVLALGAGFHPDLSGTENVSLYASVLGLTRRETAARFDEIVAFAEIGVFVHEPVRYYSTGMIARLAFSVALCSRPDVLLLDEVLSVGDERFRRRCLERLRDFRARGGTLIAVSHEPGTLRSLCSRAVWLEGGRVRMAGEIGPVLQAYRASARAPVRPA